MKTFSTFILIIICSLSYGQYDMERAKKDTTKKDREVTPYELKKKIYVGGDLSLRFGNSTYLFIGPMAGYDIYKGLSAGVTGMYQFSRFSFGSGAAVSYHSWGGGLFARYRPPRLLPLLVHMEFDIYNTDDFTTAFGGDRTNVPLFMGGLGYAGGSEKFYYQIMVMYDFIDDPNNPLPRFFQNFPIYFRYGLIFYLEQ